jgi:hypothetical protein
MGKRDAKGSFHRGQKLLRRVGNKLVPVTFLMAGPRMVVSAGKEAITKQATTALITLDDGAVLTVPIDELKPAD